MMGTINTPYSTPCKISRTSISDTITLEPNLTSDKSKKQNEISTQRIQKHEIKKSPEQTSTEQPKPTDTQNKIPHNQKAQPHHSKATPSATYTPQRQSKHLNSSTPKARKTRNKAEISTQCIAPAKARKPQHTERQTTQTHNLGNQDQKVKEPNPKELYNKRIILTCTTKLKNLFRFT